MDKRPPSLKDACKTRFIDDVVREVLKTQNGKGLILVLDDHTAKILNFFLKLTELITTGVTTIENVDRVRKAFPSFRAVYFVEPTKVNITTIQKDFETDKLYKCQHVFFPRIMSDEIFQFLKTKNFCKKLESLKEINLDFEALSDNVFRCPPSTSLDSHIDSLLSIIATQQQISTIEVLRMNHPLFKDSAYIQKFMDPKIKALLPHLNSSADGTNLKVYIFERPVDLVSPIIHDYHYESLITDLMAEEIEVYPSGESGQAPKQGITQIDEDDFLYKKFQYDFIGEIQIKLTKNLETFKSENPAAVAQKKKDDDMNMRDLNKVVTGFNEYNQFLKYYKLHFQNYVKLMKKSDEGIQRLADFERTLATSIDPNGKKVDSKVRADEVRKFISSSADEEIKLRLALIALASLNTDVSFLKEMLSVKSRKIFEKYGMLVQKYGLFIPENQKELIRGLVKKRTDESKISLSRFMTKTEILLSKNIFENSNTDFERFSYDVAGKSQSKPQPISNNTNNLFKNIIGQNKGPQTGSGNITAIVFFLEGVSYAEIGALMRLQKNSQKKLNVIVGGNAIYGPKGYLQNYMGLN
jgi:hypothetical protein